MDTESSNNILCKACASWLTLAARVEMEVQLSDILGSHYSSVHCNWDRNGSCTETKNRPYALRSACYNKCVYNTGFELCFFLFIV